MLKFIRVLYLLVQCLVLNKFAQQLLTNTRKIKSIIIKTFLENCSTLLQENKDLMHNDLAYNLFRLPPFHAGICHKYDTVHPPSCDIVHQDSMMVIQNPQCCSFYNYQVCVYYEIFKSQEKNDLVAQSYSKKKLHICIYLHIVLITNLGLYGWYGNVRCSFLCFAWFLRLWHTFPLPNGALGGQGPQVTIPFTNL